MWCESLSVLVARSLPILRELQTSVGRRRQIVIRYGYCTVHSLDNVIIFIALLNLPSWVDHVHPLLAWPQWHLRSDHGEKETIHK